MTSPHPLALLDTSDGYRYAFSDAALWQPYVTEVYRRHAQAAPSTISPTLPGTYPTFIVDGRWVIKFFGRLFDGAASFEVERQANAMLAVHPAIPAPRLIVSGSLFPDSTGWPWPYLIFEYIPGISFGEVFDRVSFLDKLNVAQDLGHVIRQLHALPVTSKPIFQRVPNAYVNFLEAQRHRCLARHRAWHTLPNHLLDQIDAFIPPISTLVDPDARPHLIHADLTGDHLLGRLDGDRWTSLGIIDFGDAMMGDLTYELVALHIHLFRCDKRLLAAFLDSYGLDAPARRDLSRKAMIATLLHRFNVLSGVFAAYPATCAIPSLDQLATLLWDAQAPVSLPNPKTPDRRSPTFPPSNLPTC